MKFFLYFIGTFILCMVTILAIFGLWLAPVLIWSDNGYAKAWAMLGWMPILISFFVGIDAADMWENRQ